MNRISRQTRCLPPSLISPSFIRLITSSSRSSSKIKSSSAAPSPSPSPSSPSPSFHPPPNSPAAFLAELKSFAAQHQSKKKQQNGSNADLSHVLPLSFSGDAALILSGERQVMAPSSPFDFACTGCGKCCESYPNDVMLDPHDVFSMSRAAGLFASDSEGSDVAKEMNAGSTTQLFRSFPKAFQAQLGLFEEAAQLQGNRSSSKLAPVLFLRTKKVKRVARGKNAQGKEEKRSSVQQRCWFSFPTEKFNTHMLDTEETASKNDDSKSASTPPHPLVTPPARSASLPSNMQKGLKCRLGPAHMPTSCALYPLGELYNERANTSPNASSSSVAAAASSSSSVAPYYTLDVTNCEGTRANSSLYPSAAHTVSSYAKNNNLPHRREQWEWFERRIAQRITRQQWIDVNVMESEQTHNNNSFVKEPEVIELLRQTIYNVWYDFDSLQAAPLFTPAASSSSPSSSPLRRFPDWPTTRSFITTATDDIIRLTQQCEQQVKEGRCDVQQAMRTWTAEITRLGYQRQHTEEQHKQ